MTITKEDVASRIRSTHFIHLPDTTTTLGILILKSGFVVIGKSACVDPKAFDKALGEEYALEDAVRQLYELEAYHIKTVATS